MLEVFEAIQVPITLESITSYNLREKKKDLSKVLPVGKLEIKGMQY